MQRCVKTLQANGVCSNACWYLDMSGKLRYVSSYYSLASLMRFVHLLSRFSSNVILSYKSLLFLPNDKQVMAITASPSSPCRSSSG